MKTSFLRIGLVATIVLAIHIFSCATIPLPWQDEVHILEMGRNVLEGVDGSAFAAQVSGKNAIPFYFIGPLAQEFSYRLVGHVGPRISSMLGLVLAALLFGKWLRLRGQTSKIADLMALLFMLNGLLTHSVRLVRVDSWAFAVLFTALIALNAQPTAKHLKGHFFCGLLCGANLFIWPSAFLFLPFVLSDMISHWSASRSHFRTILSDCTFFGLGYGIACVGILALSPCGIAETLASYYATANNDVVSGRATFGNIISSCLVVWGKELARDPFFITMAILGIALSLAKKRLTEIGLMALTFLVMIPSGLHTYRLVYLWPFLFLFATDGCARLAANGMRFFTTGMLATLSYAVWTFSLSYLAIAMLAPRTSHAERTKELSNLIGCGNTNLIYSLSFQPYYSGRELGWRQFRYASSPLIFNENVAKDMLDAANAVILDLEPDYYAIEEDVSPFGIIRNLLIKAARDDKQNKRSTVLGNIGKSLSFQAEDEARLNQLRTALGKRGFRLIGFVKDKVPAVRSPFVTVAGYDDLEVWARK